MGEITSGLRIERIADSIASFSTEKRDIRVSLCVGGCTSSEVSSSQGSDLMCCKLKEER